MLASLHIQNVALIEDIEISFGANLNVITGETGAGKSIMLDALKFVLGDRLDKSIMREGANFMKVDAIFSNLSKDVSDNIEKLSGISVDEGELFISREYNITGKTVVRVNGELITSAILKKITSYLIDIHGQHEHQAILNQDFQLTILDNYAKSDLGDLLGKLNEKIDDISAIDAKLKLLGGNEIEKQNLIDLYRYQIEEIKNANLKDGELEELEARLKEMKSSEKISQNLNESIACLDKNAYQSSASEQIIQAKKMIGQLSDLGEKYAILSDRLSSISIELDDISSSIYELISNCNFDEIEFEQIDNRIDFIKTLYRKYGGDFVSVKDYFEKINQKLDILINSEQEYTRLNNEKEQLLKIVYELQDKITEIRKQNALDMQEKIELEIRNLGMVNAQFAINFDKSTEKYTRKGQDVIQFMFSANLGFEKRPLSLVASGGELSRFMLAYKIVVNNLDNIDTLVFDEIDTGISGNTASVVAKCMGRLSRLKQLIVVTHLPQICAMADTNFLVEKSGETITKSNISMIKDSMLIKEIARLMGLMDEKGLNFAKELKLEAETYKNNL